MKLDYRCLACTLRVAAREASLFLPAERRIEFLKTVARSIAEHADPSTTPAHLAWRREELLKEFSGSEDPYKEMKRGLIRWVSDKLTGLIRDELRNIPEGYPRFRWLSLISASLNGYEAPLHPGEDPKERIITRLGASFAIDHTADAFDLIARARPDEHISFILDNAHEVPLDLLLVDAIRSMGRTVYVFAKKHPMADDATVDDLKYAEVPAKVLALESPLGIMSEFESERNISIITSSKLVIAKGMANYETLTEEEFGVPVLHLMTVKCEVIAESLGVDRGSPVALLRR